jgi:DNA-directed RNA polymerase subunit alpha
MELSIEKGERIYFLLKIKNQMLYLEQFFELYLYACKKCKVFVENFRVEQKTDYEKLVFEIKTDSSINPNALTEAA